MVVEVSKWVGVLMGDGWGVVKDWEGVEEKEWMGG